MKPVTKWASGWQGAKTERGLETLSANYAHRD